MNQWPRITVVTPSYNQAQFLRETIESVLNQNYPNLEYFVVDGGSSDGSVELIREYEAHIDWWVSEQDNGQADALRKGFDRATGDLLGWLNSDDVYFPDALFRIGRAYMCDTNASIYAGGIAIGEKNNGPIRKCVLPSSPRLWLPQYGMMRLGQQGSFYKRAVYEEIGGISSGYYIRMDGDLLYRLMKHHDKAIVFDDLIGFFRWHEASKSSSAAVRHIEERNKFRASLGLTPWQFNALRGYFRLRHVLDGAYIKSSKITNRYKGMYMQDVWLSTQK